MPKLHICDLQVTRNRYAQTWLLGSLQDWVELHLIAHSNVKVNNTSGISGSHGQYFGKILLYL